MIKSILFFTLTLSLTVVVGCSSLPGQKAKTPGNSCVLPGGATCVAIPDSACNTARGRYQAYTCDSIGFIGPCGTGPFGTLYSSNAVQCYQLKAAQKATGR